MKRYVYVLCLAVAFAGLSSCSKNNDPAPASPAVGRWELNRGLLSGFPAAANANGAALDLYLFQNVGSTIDVYSDNTFNENYRNVTIDDGAGTWDFTNNTLNLTYDNGQKDSYTYTKTKNIEEMAITTPYPFTLTVPTSATSATDYVGKVQWVYRK